MRLSPRGLIRLLVLYGLSIPVVALHAQTAKDAEQTFQQAITGQQLYLRGLDGGEKIQARWNGKSLDFAPTEVHRLAPILIETVQFSGHDVKITGKRQEVVWNQKSGFEPGAATIPVTIFVNLGRAELKTVVPALREALFFRSAEEARASVARTFGGTAPADPQVNPALAQKLNGPGPQVCDCADHGTDSCKRKVAVGGGTPFKLVHMAEPMFSAEARRHRLSGAVELTFLVDGQGNATDIWVTQPLGYGLDEQAAKAVERGEYQPATCHDKPVQVPVHMSINFDIF